MGCRESGTNMWHPKTPAGYESLPAPLATQIPTFCIHTSDGRGRGGALILDRCRAFDLFASVDAHLCGGGGVVTPPASNPPRFLFTSYILPFFWNKFKCAFITFTLAIILNEPQELDFLFLCKTKISEDESIACVFHIWGRIRRKMGWLVAS